ncbi:hypothetical protein [Streptosporangium sp. NPDC002524]|uniref:hypothetical protein n=1 Tax=Streptosporangium sp. NPDC002524 TaxID=3154537 RepID=UPI003321628C
MTIPAAAQNPFITRAEYLRSLSDIAASTPSQEIPRMTPAATDDIEPLLAYNTPSDVNGLEVLVSPSAYNKGAVLSVVSGDKVDRLSTMVLDDDLDRVVTTMYKAAGRDVVITDRVAEIEPGAWRGGGGAASVSNGAVRFNHDRVEWDMHPDAAEQMGAALILAARATRRRPPYAAIRELATALARRDERWDLVEPGDHHVNMAEGILLAFTLTPRDDV